VSRIEQSGRMSLRRPTPPIKGGSSPEEEEEEEEDFNVIFNVNFNIFFLKTTL